jgi:hypothetical protein
MNASVPALIIAFTVFQRHQVEPGKTRAALPDRREIEYLRGNLPL